MYLQNNIIGLGDVVSFFDSSVHDTECAGAEPQPSGTHSVQGRNRCHPGHTVCRGGTTAFRDNSVGGKIDPAAFLMAGFERVKF